MNAGAYIGRAPCGCAVAISLDEPGFQTYNSETLADWLRRGRTVEHYDDKDEAVALVGPHKCGQEAA